MLIFPPAVRRWTSKGTKRMRGMDRQRANNSSTSFDPNRCRSLPRFRTSSAPSSDQSPRFHRSSPSQNAQPKGRDDRSAEFQVCNEQKDSQGSARRPLSTATVITGLSTVDRSHETHSQIVVLEKSNTGSDRQANVGNHPAATKSVPCQNRWLRRSGALLGSPLYVVEVPHPP
jgi:hypothetical protein